MRAAKRHDLEQFEKLNGMECVECGSCSWGCPARLQLTQAFKEMRVAVRASKKKA
jgi:electron transport complex protein RnfC